MSTTINTAFPADALRVQFSRRLRALRRDSGVTQMELSASTGLSQGYLSRLERGTCEPSLSQLAVIADALGVHPSELLSE